MHDVRDYRALLRQIAPELDVRAVHQTHGQFNDIVIVNGAWVFRFPRSLAATATLQREVRTLRALANRLPLPIPAPTYASDDPELPYMSYRALPGEPLSRAALTALPNEALARLASQVAQFLSVLHSLPVSLLPDNTQVSDTRDYWEEMFAGFRAQLYPHMRSDARQEVTRAFTAFLADPANAEWAPVICHGDLGGSNILYDSAAGRISGIIDFGSAGPGDAASDLAALSTLGERLEAQLLAVWPGAQAMVGRARFYRSTFALQEAWYGLRDGDMEAFNSGIARYR